MTIAEEMYIFILLILMASI